MRKKGELVSWFFSFIPSFLFSFIFFLHFLLHHFFVFLTFFFVYFTVFTFFLSILLYIFSYGIKFYWFFPMLFFVFCASFSVFIDILCSFVHFGIHQEYFLYTHLTFENPWLTFKSIFFISTFSIKVLKKLYSRNLLYIHISHLLNSLLIFFKNLIFHVSFHTYFTFLYTKGTFFIYTFNRILKYD